MPSLRIVPFTDDCEQKRVIVMMVVRSRSEKFLLRRYGVLSAVRLTTRFFHVTCILYDGSAVHSTVFVVTILYSREVPTATTTFHRSFW